MSHPSRVTEKVRTGPATLRSHLQLRREWKGREELGMKGAGGTVGILRAPPTKRRWGAHPSLKPRERGLQQEGLI